jgi:hypothetical protein
MGGMLKERRLRVWSSGSGGSASAEEDHFQRWSRLVELESEAEARKTPETLGRLSPADAERTGESLISLVIVEEDSGLGGRCILTLAKRNRTLPLPWNRLPSDFTKSYGKSVDAAEVLPLSLGGNLEQARPRHIVGSPLYWVTPQAAPTLCIHGTEDKQPVGLPVVMIISSLTKKVSVGVFTYSQPDRSLPLNMGTNPSWSGSPATAAEKPISTNRLERRRMGNSC